MSGEFSNESLLDLFIFETTQNIEQLEQLILESEKAGAFSQDAVNEIFRMMHTIKGSAAMMEFTHVSVLAHSVEDLFSFIRDNGSPRGDNSRISDLVLESIDFVKEELEKIKSGAVSDGDETQLVEKISECLESLKGTKDEPKKKKGKSAPEAVAGLKPAAAGASGGVAYQAKVFFEDGCQMETIRAFSIVCELKKIASNLRYVPENVADSDSGIEAIRTQGFQLFFETDRSEDEINQFFSNIPFLREKRVEKTGNSAQKAAKSPTAAKKAEGPAPAPAQHGEQHAAATTIISVNVAKLDLLMDLIGELVISEAMVLHSPDLQQLQLPNFQKAAKQMVKNIADLQEVIMSVRMVPLTTVFQRTNRIVRDMSKKLNKAIRLEMIGEDTEVDKNIIEHISDPLMHLVRNSLDHGIESAEKRIAAGKPKEGTITLEARNEGSEVLVIVRDDGQGLNKEKILEKARSKGLLTKPESEMTEREIFSLILLPGFSTKEEITEFSGRGVGMDVVVQNIEAAGGKVIVESIVGVGTQITMKFPMTLAIIVGMNIRVGAARYSVPITEIKEFFRLSNEKIITDQNKNQMIMIRGQVYPIIRLHEIFKVEPDFTDLHDGIFIMVESGEKTACIFADELIGEQEIVVKALPKYLKKIKGLSGCALLGDGQISLILDVGGIINR